jgi:hypothetical protein
MHVQPYHKLPITYRIESSSICGGVGNRTSVIGRNEVALSANWDSCTLLLRPEPPLKSAGVFWYKSSRALKH